MPFEPSQKREIPIKAGPTWQEVLGLSRASETIITRLQAHLSSTGLDDLVYTDYFSSVPTALKGSVDIVERLILVGSDGVGRKLRRRSFDDDPTDLVEDIDAIYLCQANEAGRPDLAYLFVDSQGHDDKAKLMCRRSDFDVLHKLLRMGGKGGVLWRGKYVEQDDDILGLNENDYVFENDALSHLLDQTVNFLSGEVAERLRTWGLPPKRGVILYGRPGNGKTILSRLCAKHALQRGINVVIIEGRRRSKFSYESGNMGLGDELRQAAARGPALLLFEDVDLHCPTRSVDSDERKASDNTNLAELLEFLDGVVLTNGYVLLATTNYIDRIDPALARSGRLEERFEVNEPGLQSRIEVLSGLLEIGPEPRPDVTNAAKLLDGASFADLTEVSRRFKMAVAYNAETSLDILLDRAARDLATERSLISSDAVS